ncbi:MAG: hypothetical protein U0641_04840 [Anaerolineae bacterium]
MPVGVFVGVLVTVGVLVAGRVRVGVAVADAVGVSVIVGVGVREGRGVGVSGQPVGVASTLAGSLLTPESLDGAAPAGSAAA